MNRILCCLQVLPPWIEGNRKPAIAITNISCIYGLWLSPKYQTTSQLTQERPSLTIFYHLCTEMSGLGLMGAPRHGDKGKGKGNRKGSGSGYDKGMVWV